jgi:hypothetical protein
MQEIGLEFLNDLPKSASFFEISSGRKSDSVNLSSLGPK